MAIAFDAASNSGVQNSQSTYSWNHTCGSGNTVILVGIVFLSNSSVTVSSVTYAGTNLTQKSSATSGNFRSEIWALVAPTAGLNSVTVSFSSSVGTSISTATSLTGVDQSTPTEAATSGSGTTWNATVSTTTVADNDWLYNSFVSSTFNAITSTGTARSNVTSAAGPGASATYGPETPPGSFAQTWSGGNNGIDPWLMAVVAVRPAAAAVGGPVIPKVIVPILERPPDVVDFQVRAGFLASGGLIKPTIFPKLISVIEPPTPEFLAVPLLGKGFMASLGPIVPGKSISKPLIAQVDEQLPEIIRPLTVKGLPAPDVPPKPMVPGVDERQPEIIQPVTRNRAGSMRPLTTPQPIVLTTPAEPPPEIVRTFTAKGFWPVAPQRGPLAVRIDERQPEIIQAVTNHGYTLAQPRTPPARIISVNETPPELVPTFTRWGFGRPPTPPRPTVARPDEQPPELIRPALPRIPVYGQPGQPMQRAVIVGVLEQSPEVIRPYAHWGYIDPPIPVPPTPPTLKPPYRVAAGMIFAPGAVAGQLSGQP